MSALLEALFGKLLNKQYFLRAFPNLVEPRTTQASYILNLNSPFFLSLHFLSPLSPFLAAVFTINLSHKVNI